jgi:hypothetical protein
VLEKAVPPSLPAGTILVGAPKSRTKAAIPAIASDEEAGQEPDQRRITMILLHGAGSTRMNRKSNAWTTSVRAACGGVRFSNISYR